MRKERVLKAIQHQETDFVPYNIELTSEELELVSDYLGIKKEDFFEFSGNHIEKASYNIGGKYIKPGIFQDEYGVVWNRTGLDKDIGIIENITFKEPDLKGYTFPAPPIDEVRKVTLSFINNGRDTFKLGKIGMTYYERAWSLRGIENLLMDLILEQKFAGGLFEGILNYNLQIIDTALQYDIDGFYFGDDYGQQTGMIMSPDSWRKMIKPGLKKMFERVKASGKIVALHSCGNITDVLGDLIDIGLDIYQTFQPELYNLREIKQKFGNNLTFWGGISTQQTLPFASPDELKKIILDTISVMAVNGGYIAAPTHQVPADVLPRNIAAMLEVLKNQ